MNRLVKTKRTDILTEKDNKQKLMIMLLYLISKEREKSSNLQFYIEIELFYLLIINNLTGNNYGKYCFWIRIH